MTEHFLHYLFETRKLGKNFVTTEGDELIVEEFGTLNPNSGPDFLVAKVKYKQTTWAGHIEFHKNSSDWINHGHQYDSAYNNVIAHFVYHHDRDIYSGDYRLPTVELKEQIKAKEYEKYCNLIDNNHWIPCQKFANLSSVIQDEIPLQLKKRIERKSREFYKILSAYNGDINKVLLWAIFRTIGGKVNRDGFSSLFDKIDMSHIQKLNFDRFKLQAYFHGISGLLPDESCQTNKSYVNELIQEFAYQRKLFDLEPLPKEIWKFSTFRPASHPTNRIAQLAAWVSTNPTFINLLAYNYTEFKELFKIQLDEFWDFHFHFNRESKKKKSTFSKNMIDQLIINAVVPVLNLQAIYKDQPKLNKKAVNLLKEIPAEKNKIITHWKKLGAEIGNAADSQALIELKNENCSFKNCLRCQVGKAFMKK